MDTILARSPVNSVPSNCNKCRNVPWPIYSPHGRLFSAHLDDGQISDSTSRHHRIHTRTHLVKRTGMHMACNCSHILSSGDLARQVHYGRHCLSSQSDFEYCISIRAGVVQVDRVTDFGLRSAKVGANCAWADLGVGSISVAKQSAMCE